MTIEEMQNAINEVRQNLNDLPKVTELLNNIGDSFSEVVKNNTTLTETNQKLTTDNDKLRNVNMDLFLKVGEKRTNTNAEIKTEQKQENNIPSFDDLFDNEGNLK